MVHVAITRMTGDSAYILEGGPGRLALRDAARRTLYRFARHRTRCHDGVVQSAAYFLGDRFVLDHLVGGSGGVALADIAVADRGAGEHVDRPGLGAMGLSAPVRLSILLCSRYVSGHLTYAARRSG